MPPTEPMSKNDLAKIEWEGDPYVFIFKENIPGKVKMATKPMELKDWILIDSTYPSQMTERLRLLNEKHDEVYISQDDQSTTAAKRELFELICQHLLARFPAIFVRKDDSTILNRVTGEEISTDQDGGEDPLIRISRMTQDDWCVMQWDETAQSYKLTAGVVTFPMRWSVIEKFQRPLAEIHAPVKPFGKHLAKQVYSLFRAMKPSNPIWRANWALFHDLDGPLHLFTPEGHVDRQKSAEVVDYQDQDTTGQKLVFRAEYQTLRKLPKTGAIAFGIRTYQRYLNDFNDRPTEDLEDLLAAVETLDPDFYEYKGAKFWSKAALQWLRTAIKARKKSEARKVGMYVGGGVLSACVVCVAVYVGYRLLQAK